MSQDPNKKPRTSTEIQNENFQLTVKAGQIQYIVAQHQKDLVRINDCMRDLALEHVQVKAREEELAQAVADAKAKDEADAKAAAAAGKALLQSVTQKDSSDSKQVDQASTQPGSETKESAPASPVGQG